MMGPAPIGPLLLHGLTLGAGATGIAGGVLLMGWIIKQVRRIGFRHWLQPMIFTVGAIEVALGVGLWTWAAP